MSILDLNISEKVNRNISYSNYDFTIEDLEKINKYGGDMYDS